MPRPTNLLPLRTEDYTAIGRVATEWSVLEGFISYAVRVLLGSNDQIGRVVTANSQSLGHCDMLMALLKMRFPNKPREVASLCRKIRELGEDHPSSDDTGKRRSLRTRRNEVVHGSWIEAAQAPTLFTVTYKARGTLKHTTTVQTPEKVNALADEIAAAMDAIYDALTPLLEAWAELHKRRP